MSTGKAVLADVGVVPNGQQAAATKQVLCSADDKLSNSLPTTSHVGRNKARPLWLPTKRRAQSHGRAALGASSRSEGRLASDCAAGGDAGHVARYN
ncbi:hypothetical protein Q7P35_004218 [Cladosporium inversicolor]